MSLSAATERAALLHASRQTQRQRSELRQWMLDAATADGKGGASSTGVRWWLKFILYGRSSSPTTRLTAASPLEDKLEAESLVMDFAIWLAVCNPSGMQISAKTIGKYISAVRGWHLRTQGTHLCGDIPYNRIRDLVKGLKRRVKQPLKERRWGVRTQDLAKSMAMGLDLSTQIGSMWVAALSVGFCGLMRGAELALQDGHVFDPTVSLTRADVKFKIESDGTESVTLRMRPAKGEAGQTKTVPLVLGGGGRYLDPVAAIQRMIELDPIDTKNAATTPLFRRFGAAITVRQLRACVKSLMGLLGLDHRRFGAHSLRIGGATAALAGNVSPSAIRAAGRWSSDVYIIYTRATRQAAVSVSMVIGSTLFEDTERGVHFCDEELMLVPEEMPSVCVEDFVEQDLIDDALEDEA
jgi:hypothetical protein